MQLAHDEYGHWQIILITIASNNQMKGKIWKRYGLSINNILNKVKGILCVHVHFPCNNSPHPKAHPGSQLNYKLINNVQSMETYKEERWSGVQPLLSLVLTSTAVFINKSWTTSRWPSLQWHKQRDMHGWSIILLSTGNFDSSVTLSHNTVQSPWQPVVQQCPGLCILIIYCMCVYMWFSMSCMSAYSD